MDTYRHRVQYYETDQMKIVHHSNYIRWFEEARIDYLEKAGISYTGMEERGIVSPVVSVGAKYLRMVRFGDEVRICVRTGEYNGVKLCFMYEVWDEKMEILYCSGTSVHCFVNGKGRLIAPKRELPDYHEVFVKCLEQDQAEARRQSKKK
ncbi:MAG: acyl-CoA thioesterase [Coprococcus sp.]|nr:acyl-CoA thioesterase [Coprococcus sp.]